MQENMINEEAVEETKEEQTAKSEKGDKKKIKTLEKELEDAISYSISGNTEDIDVSIFKADRKQGIIEIVVEVTYKQPTGQSKTITMERIYRDT